MYAVAGSQRMSTADPSGHYDLAGYPAASTARVTFRTNPPFPPPPQKIHAPATQQLQPSVLDAHPLSVFANRAQYPILSAKSLQPDVVPSERTLGILERIAANVGLPETFREAAMSIDSDTASSGDHTMLTIASKVLILDMDVATNGQITQLRFTHGQDSTPDPGIAALLSNTLANVHVLEGTDAIQRAEEGYRAFQNALADLADLERVSNANAEEQSDCFAACSAITSASEDLFKSELDVALKPEYLLTQGHGLVFCHHLRPYSTILYHLPAYQLAGDAWTMAREAGFAYEGVDALLKLPDARTLCISLAMSTESETSRDTTHKPSFPLLPTSPLLELESSTKHCYMARLSHPLAITRAVAQKLQDVFPAAKTIPSSLLQRICFARLLTTQEALDGCELQLGNEDPSLQFSHNRLDQTAGFFVDVIPFKTQLQLVILLELLNEQSIFNELFSSCFEGDSLNYNTASNHVHLEELFDSINLDSLPISVSVEDTYPPTLNIAFPAPHLPPQSTYTASLRIQSNRTHTSGLHIEFSGRLADHLDDSRKQKVMTIAHQTRNIPLVIRSVCKGLKAFEIT